MKQNRFEALLIMFVVQELLSKINYGYIIDEVKTMAPHDRRLIL